MDTANKPRPHMFKHLLDYGVTYMSVLHIQSDFDQHNINIA